jgi:hypothetical protein
MTDFLGCKHEVFKRRKAESTVMGFADLRVNLLHIRTGFQKLDKAPKVVEVQVAVIFRISLLR